MITFAQIQSAIARCCDAHPPNGIELKLHPDASCLCDIMGAMIHARLQSVDPASIGDRQREALTRWSES
jgi:hypothetical protein